MRAGLILICTFLVGCGLFQTGDSDEFVGYATETECLRDVAVYESLGPGVELFYSVSPLKKAVLKTSLAPCVEGVSVYRQKHGLAAAPQEN